MSQYQTIDFDIRKEEDYTQPFIILLSNNTDDTQYKVNVFNHQHDKQDKIAYSTPFDEEGSRYEDVLRFLSSMNNPESTIFQIQASANCQYNKEFATNQLSSKIYEKYFTINGSMHSFEHKFPRDPAAAQKDIDRLSDLDIVFFNRMQIQLEYLLPKTSLALFFYRKKRTES